MGCEIIPFWGISGHYPSWFPERDFYLVSAASLWSRQRGKFIKRSYPRPRVRMFLDSGGFSFFSRQGDYPFSPDEYLRLVEHPYYGYQPLLWASLDYPCEAEVDRSPGLVSNMERIEATLDHLAYFKRVSTWPGLVPVVQGYTVNERLYCLQEIARRGLGSRLMAIGSLCAMKSERAIDEIIAAVGAAGMELFEHRVYWHAFGVKLSYFKLLGARGFPFLFSFDTAAWGIGDTGETKNARGSEEAERRFWRYRRAVARLMERIERQRGWVQLCLPLGSVRPPGFNLPFQVLTG